MYSMLINKQLIFVESNVKILFQNVSCVLGHPIHVMRSVSVHSNDFFFLKKSVKKLHRFHICTKFEICANLKRFCTIPKSETAK